MNYKMTIRRRLPDGSLEEAEFTIAVLNGDLELTPQLIFDLEMQANAAHPMPGQTKPAVRVWVEELEEVAVGV